MDTLKPYSNESLYGDTALAVDGWVVTFGTAGGAWAGCGPTQSPPLCTKCNSPPINGQLVYVLYIIQCGTIIASAL